MPITEHQRAQRIKHIGSSDAAAILGVSPYANAYDIWAEKTGKLIESDLSGNEAVALGSALEPALIDWCAEQIGMAVTKNQYRVHSNGILAANHDALVKGAQEGVEAKTTGLLGRPLNGWGDPDIQLDAVPQSVIIQCVQQMIVSDLNCIWVPALIGGRGRLLFCIKFDVELCETVEERLTEFWQQHVMTDIPPPDITPSLDIAKRFARVPEKITTIDEALIETWENAKATEKEAKANREESQAAVLAALADAEAAHCGRFGAVTYFSQTARRLDPKRLRADHPEIAKEYTNEFTSRVLRIKKKGL